MDKWARILYQPNIPLGKDGQRLTACKEHILLSKNAAKEGMVLLKNDGNVLPFSPDKKLALFGKGTFDYVKGGGGSGDVTVAYTVDLYGGLKSLNVPIEEELADYYRQWVRSQYAAGVVPGLVEEPELPESLCLQARAFTDTAVISISRFSGEGWDRTVENDPIPESKFRSHSRRSAEIFEKGDFYLSAAESRMVEAVKAHFPKIVVVLNVGGVVDTEWFAADDRIQGALLAWQGGMEGGRATAELLLGIDNPSGKLSDTFAKKLNDYPSSKGFHESEGYVDYHEDIYVGYRYFETLPDAAQRVNYPFGYGLSYTNFDIAVSSAKERDGEISVCALVKNIGSRPGKEVVQLYASAPQGLLGKPAKSLVAFQKTDLLQPGEAQDLVLSFRMNDLASYDDLGKIEKSSYVLEKGEYIFYIGNSVRNTQQLEYVHSEYENKVVQRLQPRLVPTSLNRRLLANGTYENLPLGQTPDPDETALEPMDPVSKYGGDMPAVRAVDRIPRRSRERVGGPDFNLVACGKLSLDDFVSQMSDAELAHLLGGQPNTGAANTWGFGNMPEYHIPNVMTADGPAGLRLKPECGVTTTAFPCATQLSCTWNPEITYAVGRAGAQEVKENNLAVWLTPAVNIHRSPLCGRNFEYYSEDPLLAGKMASAMVKGIQSERIAPSVKHFALNNKETNRKDSDSRVSERAAREIYLKPFEIVVKEAKPKCIMSAYNLVNGYRASECRDLLEGILREEWGFDGMVTTDWWTYGEHYKEVAAGNDLKMACGYPERLLAAVNLGVLSRTEIEISAKRILSLILWLD